MTRGQFMRLVLISASSLIIVGVIIMAIVLSLEGAEDVIKVDIDSKEAQVVEFESLSLIPGESCEYVIKLDGDRSSQYDVTLDFVDLDKEKTLKNFARVRVESGEEIICDKLLVDAIEKEDVTVPVDLKKKKNSELKIVYYLPLDVGNEAKNAEAEFELHIMASNE